VACARRSVRSASVPRRNSQRFGFDVEPDTWDFSGPAIGVTKVQTSFVDAIRSPYRNLPARSRGQRHPSSLSSRSLVERARHFPAAVIVGAPIELKRRGERHGHRTLPTGGALDAAWRVAYLFLDHGIKVIGLEYPTYLSRTLTFGGPVLSYGALLREGLLTPQSPIARVWNGTNPSPPGAPPATNDGANDDGLRSKGCSHGWQEGHEDGRHRCVEGHHNVAGHRDRRRRRGPARRGARANASPGVVAHREFGSNQRRPTERRCGPWPGGPTRKRAAALRGSTGSTPIVG
jgi:hypothetical protein